MKLQSFFSDGSSRHNTILSHLLRNIGDLKIWCHTLSAVRIIFSFFFSNKKTTESAIEPEKKRSIIYQNTNNNNGDVDIGKRARRERELNENEYKKRRK